MEFDLAIGNNTGCIVPQSIGPQVGFPPFGAVYGVHFGSDEKPRVLSPSEGRFSCKSFVKNQLKELRVSLIFHVVRFARGES